MAEDKNDKRSSKKLEMDISPFRDFISHMDTFFDQSFRQMNDVFHFKPFQLKTRETENYFIVEAELPGYKRNQVAIEIIGNQLRIGIDNTENVIDQDSGFFKKSQERMERTVTLPFEIPEDETTATFQNGILKITVPKQNTKRRYIDIKD